MAITLTAAVDAAIRAHGRETFPHECCGAMLGTDGVVGEAFKLPNTTEEGPRRRFLVRPDDYRIAEQRAREAGLDLLGFYHSHPDHPARPSAFDREHAWPGYAYLIVSVAKGLPDELRGFRFDAPDEPFAEIELDLEPVPEES